MLLLQNLPVLSGLVRFMAENEFSFDVISNGIETWNYDPISKQLSRTIDLYNISNVIGTQTESEIDIATLKMLEFCNSGNLLTTRVHAKPLLFVISLMLIMVKRSFS